jgi:hypothetical protein
VDDDPIDDYPVTVWRYRVDLPVAGSERQGLVDALEAEDLGLFEDMPREDVYRAIRAGRLRFDGAREAPAEGFAADLAVLSLFLFQVVSGLEIAERHVSETATDAVSAWKVLARRGEWVKVPLLVAADGEGRFRLDPDAEDLEAVRARWHAYPLWFRDGMRRKHPPLRSLPA